MDNLVIPAKAGIQKKSTTWTPAFAGVTVQLIRAFRDEGRVQPDMSG
ncbi:MAG: hypothetical protein M1547_13025 [Gammaproteobacteria bacterium]|nr:hypothetical protein [Gammaproteobacteria bacterium]